MKDYETAIKFEKAGQVRRLLELSGKRPSYEDDLYIHELGHRLSESDTIRITEVESWWADISDDSQEKCLICPI